MNINHLYKVSGALAVPVVLALASCEKKSEMTLDLKPAKEKTAAAETSYGKDVAFLKEHTDAVVLTRGDASVVVVPEYQGRVMTATAQGDGGPSSGWINYDVVEKGVLTPEEAKGKLEEHMYAFGGEERFWMGPEGGQFSIFFKPGKPFEFKDWHTPASIDTAKWKLKSQDEGKVVLTHEFDLLNHSGTEFKVGVERTVTLLDDSAVTSILKKELPNGIDTVAYRTDNQVTNLGDQAWKKDTGLLSIWMLCMFQPSPTTTVFIPHVKGEESELGPIVNADYFGAVPPERLKVDDGVIYFKADGKQRGKIGLPPGRSTGVAGSYDSKLGRVTLLVYNQPKEHQGYVNSMWEMQEHPYQGDAINSYNDGPVDDSGDQMGPFYELESSSPALALTPQQSGTHSQTIIHLYGDLEKLQQSISGLLSVDLKKVSEILD